MISRNSESFDRPDPNLFVLKIDPDAVLATFRDDIVSLLQDFSSLYSVPIVLILNGRQEYLSGQNQLSSFCRVLWSHSGLRDRCLQDHQSRDGQTTVDLQYRPCHAGLLNLSLALDLDELGKGTLLAGQRPHQEADLVLRAASEQRYHEFLIRAEGVLSPAELLHLKVIRESAESIGSLGEWNQEADLRFVRGLGRTLESYINRRYHEELQKMRFERAVSRILHELANTSVYMDLNSNGLIRMLDKAQTNQASYARAREHASWVRAMAIEARYEMVNLLQALSGGRGTLSLGKEPEWIDVMDIVRDLWPAFTFLASHENKRIRFEAPAGQDLNTVKLPRFNAFGGMLRRALYNVFSNALKYSYFTSALSEQDRFIAVRATPRYSPNNRNIFALSFSNYGIAFESEQERRRATEFGFRGKAAVAERPIGSGIGLNEVRRIMRLHGGYVRIQSDPIGRSPALTVVWLIFRVPSSLKMVKSEAQKGGRHVDRVAGSLG